VATTLQVGGRLAQGELRKRVEKTLAVARGDGNPHLVIPVAPLNTLIRALVALGGPGLPARAKSFSGRAGG